MRHPFSRYIQKPDSSHYKELQAISGQTGAPVAAIVRRVHGELLNWAKIRYFLGFDTMPGCAMSSSFSFI